MQQKDGAKSHCDTPVGRFKDEHGVEHPVNCNRWGCPHCTKVKKTRIRNRFEFNHGGFRYRMMTLTEVKALENFENSKEIMKHWNHFRSNMKRAGHKIDRYFWTKEYKPRKDGSDPNVLYPHLHVIIATLAPVSLIREHWEKATGNAKIVHIPEETFEVKNSISYMMKYLGKSDFLDGFSHRERRFGFSRNFPAKEQIVMVDLGELFGGMVQYIPWSRQKHKGTFILNARLDPLPPPPRLIPIFESAAAMNEEHWQSLEDNPDYEERGVDYDNPNYHFTNTPEIPDWMWS